MSKLLGWRLLTGAILTLVVASAAAPAARANGSALPRTELAGQLVVSDVLLAPGLAASESGLASLQRFQRQTVARLGGFWRLHMLAFLDRAPESELVSLVAYDVTTPQGRHQVRVFEVPVEGSSRTVQINDFVVSQDMGFQPGHRYELVVQSSGIAEGLADPGAGERKPDIYAKGVVTLR